MTNPTPERLTDTGVVFDVLRERITELQHRASSADRLAEALEQIRDEYPWHVDGPGKIADDALRLYREGK